MYSKFSIFFSLVCGQHIKNKLAGTVSLKPGGGYDDSELCEWIIEFPVGKRISLKTKFFQLEGVYPSCNFDRLQIHDGSSINNTIIGKFCGYNKPPHIQSLTNFLYIRFESDGSKNGEGFELEFSEAPLSKFTFPSVIEFTLGKFTSPVVNRLYP